MTGKTQELEEVLVSAEISHAIDESVAQNGEPSRPPPSWRSTFTDITNMLKAFIGLNFMYVAYAFLQAGLVRGVLGLCFIAFITEHCCLLLVQVKGQMPARDSRKKPPTYGDIGFFVGGKPMEIGINAALVLTQFGYCVGYLIFISQTVHDLMGAEGRVWMFIFIPVPILSGLAMLKSIRSLGPFSLFANAALLTGFIAVVVYIGRHFQWQKTHPSWQTYPLFFGQMTAALEGIGLVIPVETSMRDPSQFPFVLRTALFILATVLMTVGTLGYMTFGTDTRSILLLNFGQSPVVNVVKVILVCGILFTYPLQIFPVFQLVEGYMLRRAERRAERRAAASVRSATPPPPALANGESSELQQLNTATEYSESETEMSESDDEVQESSVTPVPNTTRPPVERRERFVREKVRIVFRLAIVIATAMTAMLAGANFGLFQSLVGSMGASCLAYSAPALFHVVVFGRQLSFREKLKDWLIVAFGVVGAIVGTLATLYEFSKVHEIKL